MTDAAAGANTASQAGFATTGGGDTSNATTQTTTTQTGGEGTQVNTQTTGNRDWLPEEYRTHPTFKDINDVSSLAKTYVEAQKLVGAKVLAKPAAGAPAEQIAAYRKAIGVPDAPTGYKIPDVKFPEGVAYPVEKFTDELKVAAAKLHELGAPPEVAEGILDFYVKGTLSTMDEIMATEKQKAAQKADADDSDFASMTKEAFGDKAAAVVSGAQALLAKFVPESLAPELQSLNNKQLFAVLNVIDGIRGEYISEDRMPKGGMGGNGGQATDAERYAMMAERQKLMADPITNKTRLAELNDKIARAYGRTPNKAA